MDDGERSGSPLGRLAETQGGFRAQGPTENTVNSLLTGTQVTGTLLEILPVV